MERKRSKLSGAQFGKKRKEEEEKRAKDKACLLCYTYDVVYRPGSFNCAADCLSRLPLPMKSDGALDPDIVAFVTGLPTLSAEDFISASESRPELIMLTHGYDLDPVLVPFFLCVDGVLVMRSEYRAVVSQLVNLVHETHQGIVQTKKRLPPDPWQKLGIDIVGPFDSGPSDCRFAISLIDYHSKWPEVAFALNVTAKVVTSFLHSVFSRAAGNPQCVIMDSSPQFLFSVFAGFLKERGISHVRSSLYYPQGNGVMERWNKVLKECILSAEQMGKPWKHAVTEFLQNYRATSHSTSTSTTSTSSQNVYKAKHFSCGP
ncbi:hypothetical protein QQF64_009803 [Cirrhinus molitorella]|uniref:Integrase catalytic domain-containing protein n=1 Tax=Cirrhinus molitorella TaxID=172907 RepID=A0ABR3M4Q3_9TELE